jgi:hypothetical protein
MISDWTIYGYVGDGEVLCPPCFDKRPNAKAFTRGDFRDDPDDGEGWHGLLSIADTGEDGLSCGDCGEYIFEPDLAYMHEEYGHPEHVDGCELCRAVEAQDETWALEHEAREHLDEPVLGPRTIRDGWLETDTRAGCPDCEREYSPAPGQLELSPAAEHDYDAGCTDCVNPDPMG